DDKGAKNEKWVWEEVGSEGGASSVNTYDNMHVTLGKGFAAGGALEAVLKTLFAKDAEVKNQFLDAGLALDAKSQWPAVNTVAGGAGFSALSGAATLETIEDAAADTTHAGKYLFPNGKKTYYVLAP